MKEPTTPSTETRMVVLADDLEITPNQLFLFACSINEPVEIKQTCYGLIIQGDRKTVKKMIGELRAKLPYAIFTKERGFCIGSKAKCRHGRTGGISGAPRPGFHQLQIETSMLSMIGKAIMIVDSGESLSTPERTSKQLDKETLKKMIDIAMSEMESEA